MLPQARVMARSLRRHEPSWTLDIALIGSSTQADNAGDEFHVVSIEDELGFDSEELVARHQPTELVTMLVPRLLRERCRRGSGPVIHLPATTWIVDELGPLTAPLCDHSLLLAPRAGADPPDDGLEPTSRQLTKTGWITAQLMAVDGSGDAQHFLTWWIQRLDAMIGAPDGSVWGHRRENRRWMHRLLELAPARFGAAILEDPGCNLSIWNLHEHSLQESESGILVDGRWPLRFLDLSGFEPDHPYRLSATCSRIRLSRIPVLKALSARYAQQLLDSGWTDASRQADVGRRLANGILFDETMQSLYASAWALGEDLGDPLSAPGTAALMTWLAGPAPRGGSHGVNRYLFARLARERPDVTAAYPVIDGADGPRLVAWSRVHGRHEMDIPDELLPAPGTESPREVSAPGAVVATSAPARPGRGRERATEFQSAAVGVRVTGFFEHILGLGAAARGYVRALEAVGVPLSTVTVSLDHLQASPELAPGYGRRSYEDVVAEGGHTFELLCVNADQLPHFVERLGEDHFHGPRIGVWGWETNSIPSRWGPAFELVDEIWVYSRFMAENIGSVAPVPVVAVPPPVQAPREDQTPLRLGVPEGFLFLFLFDYYSTPHRKNPVGLIQAFKAAFAPGEGPRLLIKTINADAWPLAEEEVLWAADGRADIHVIDRSLSSAEKDALMATCDCYVSLHRSEGFGLTMAEAMSIGKPVIATGYSGNLDFMTPDNSFLVEYEITRVGPGNPIYPADGEWAEPSVEHASALMRRVYDGPDAAARAGERARRDIARILSPHSTGAAMRRRLQQLADQKARP